MSKLTIINDTKPSDGCAMYDIYAPQGQSLEVEYVDCYGGRLMKLVIPDDGSNQATLSDTICARIGSVIVNGSYVQRENFQCQKWTDMTITIDKECNQSGWENGATGGSTSCQGSKLVPISRIVGTEYGFIRFREIYHSDEIGLSKANGTDIKVGEVIPVSESLLATLYAQCTNVYPCMPTINRGSYIVEYSPYMDEWYPINVEVV